MNPIETEMKIKNTTITDCCMYDDCQRYHDHCVDCFRGDLYLSPDIPESDYHESTLSKPIKWSKDSIY